jgi:two-component system response regulator AtoC
MSNDTQTRKSNTVMVIEDDPMVRKLLQAGLDEDGRKLFMASSCEEAFSQIDAGSVPEVIILDLSLPGMGGIEFLKVVRKRYPFIKAVILSADDGVDTIVETMRLGALDFIPKPFKLEYVRIAVNEALQFRQLQVEIDRSLQRNAFHDDARLLYTSSAMASVMETIQRVASTTVPVLITGASGVGKELVAREIHQRSDRSKGPFVKVNCAALPANLLEGELFGFEKGAFTGAVKSKPAKFERANDGTFFLDEIGELELELQAKLLHVLQDGSFSRLGSNKMIKSKARMVVATNRNIESAVNKGEFRSDLYYRLNVIRIHVPPLCERPSDIMVLADHFLLRTNLKFGKSVEFDDETREYLLRHPWPGNVRELENAVSRYVVLGKLGSGFELTGASRVDPFDPVEKPINGLNQDVDPAPEQHEDSEVSRKHPHDGMPLKEIARNAAREAEKKAIISALETTRWNRSRAALILKISYKALLYKIKDCGIVRP